MPGKPESTELQLATFSGNLSLSLSHLPAISRDLDTSLALLIARNRGHCVEVANLEFSVIYGARSVDGIKKNFASSRINCFKGFITALLFPANTRILVGTAAPAGAEARLRGI